MDDRGTGWAAFGIAMVVAALAALVIVGGWAAGWWFTNQNTQREAHMIRNGYANQQTLREQITAQIANTDTLTTQIAGTSDLNLIRSTCSTGKDSCRPSPRQRYGITPRTAWR